MNVKQSVTGKRPLHYSIEHRDFKGYKNLIYTLLEHGADPNVRDANGDVPLLQILYGGYEPLERHRREALALLLNETHITTDINVSPPGTLNLPLHLAVRRKDPWAVGMLLEKEATVNEPNGAGITPFAMTASSWSENMTEDQVEVAKLLLLHGANVNEQIGSTGSTALQIAISHGLADLVELLREYEADPMVNDNAGQTAFDTARLSMENGKTTAEAHVKIMQLLFDAINEDTPEEGDICAVTTAIESETRKQQRRSFNLGPILIIVSTRRDVHCSMSPLRKRA